MICFHKYGKVENGYQYCSKCGKAARVKCSHIWKNYKQYNCFDSKLDEIPRYVKFILMCQKCGSLKKFIT